MGLFSEDKEENKEENKPKFKITIYSGGQKILEKLAIDYSKYDTVYSGSGDLVFTDTQEIKYRINGTFIIETI